MAPYADELVVLPTRAHTKEEADCAVGFVIPADCEDIKIIAVPSSGSRKHYPAPAVQYGTADGFIIFENTFIPWERVVLSILSNTESFRQTPRIAAFQTGHS